MGGEWYLEKRGSWKILAGSRNLGSIFDKSRSLVFSWFAFTFFESRNFSPKSLGLGFLTGISASRWVSDFTIRHPSPYGTLFFARCWVIVDEKDVFITQRTHPQLALVVPDIEDNRYLCLNAPKMKTLKLDTTDTSGEVKKLRYFYLYSDMFNSGIGAASWAKVVRSL